MSKIKFREPPVHQVSLVLEFEELYDFSSVHFGLYWQTIRERFPKTVDLESGGSDYSESSPIPLPRVGFLTEDESRIIEIQNNAFIYNWRKKTENQYPDFDNILEEFNQQWQAFQDWWLNLNDSAQEGDAVITIINQQISYTNLIDQKSGWIDSKNIADIFTFMNKSWSKKELFPQSLACKLLYGMTRNLGILEVSVKQLFEESPRPKNSSIVLLNLEAIRQGSSKYDIIEWFKLSHEYIVKCFLSLIQNPVKEKWGIYYK